MIAWMLWLPALFALYVAGEMLAELILPPLTRPVGRWLRERRSPWFLSVLWSCAALGMAAGWWLGIRGTYPGAAAALFIGAGTAAVAGTINWYHVANDLDARRDRPS